MDSPTLGDQFAGPRVRKPYTVDGAGRPLDGQKERPVLDIVIDAMGSAGAALTGKPWSGGVQTARLRGTMQGLEMQNAAMLARKNLADALFGEDVNTQRQNLADTFSAMGINSPEATASAYRASGGKGFADMTGGLGNNLERELTQLLAEEKNLDSARATAIIQALSRKAPGPIEVPENYVVPAGMERQFGDVRTAPRTSRNTPSQIQVYEYTEDLTPEQRKRFLETVRGQQVRDIGGVPTIIGPGGSLIPLSSLDRETAARLGLASAGAMGSGQGQRMTAAIDSGLAAADAMSATRRGLELLDEVNTGGLSAVLLKASNLFGITGADEGELSANLGKAVLSQLRSTFGAAFTEREGARLAEIEAGFGKSTATNRRLLEQVQKTLDRAARRGLAAADDAGDTFTANEIRKALGIRAPTGTSSRASASPDGWSVEVIE